MRIKDIQKMVHELAKLKGWHDGTPRTALEIHMLIVSEIAEATEAVRKNEPHIFWMYDGKPEGELVELADAVIRILDYCEVNGWDLEEAIAEKHSYNETRSYRHGNKTK
jgi:NTP pyrophosphatase (non-canonical NTP hydrolase)